MDLDEGWVSVSWGWGWVVWLSFWVYWDTFVADIGDESGVVISLVCDSLYTAIGKVDLVRSAGDLAIWGFLGVEVSLWVIIGNSVLEGKWSGFVVDWSWGMIRGWSWSMIRCWSGFVAVAWSRGFISCGNSGGSGKGKDLKCKGISRLEDRMGIGYQLE